jgi:hypothetical protein
VGSLAWWWVVVLIVGWWRSKFLLFCVGLAGGQSDLRANFSYLVVLLVELYRSVSAFERRAVLCRLTRIVLGGHGYEVSVPDVSTLPQRDLPPDALDMSMNDQMSIGASSCEFWRGVVIVSTSCFVCDK